MNKKKLGRSQHWPRVLSRRPRFPGTCGLGREGWPPPGWRVGQKTGGSRAVGEKGGPCGARSCCSAPRPHPPRKRGAPTSSFCHSGCGLPAPSPLLLPLSSPQIPTVSGTLHNPSGRTLLSRPTPGGHMAGQQGPHPGSRVKPAPVQWPRGRVVASRERELRWASRAVSPGSLHALAVTLTSQSLAVLLGPRIPRLRTVSFVLLMD